MHQRTLLASALAGLMATTTAQADRMPTAEEMWRIIQAQQKEIEALKQQVHQTEAKAEAAVEAVETTDSTGHHGTGGGSAWAERTRIGGYGEMHYNSLEGKGGASDKDEIDFHRFVLFFGHQFSDRVRFFSELEVEHALTGNGEPGEVELEQAYVEFDLNDNHRAKAGLFLVPAGILNETHEPGTFYGTERNPVENNIIPTTWWAGGAGLSGNFGNGFSYDAAVHEGMNTSAAASYKVRSGRQKTAKATAKDFAFTGRIKWTGMPGVELAATFQHQSDITQGSDPAAGSANLYEAHAILSKGPFGLRALYALWDLDGSGPAAIGADEQSGWYIEPSYKVNDRLGLFARYNQWDNQAGSDTGSAANSEKSQWDIGINFWPHPDVVIKADYQNQDNDNGQDQDGFNLGVGYQF